MKTILPVCLCALGILNASATETEYVWQSSDGDPSGLQGEIVLDSSSNPNGNLSDIISISLYSQSFGFQSFDLATLNPPIFSYGLSSDLSWNSSEITSMSLEVTAYFRDSDSGMVDGYLGAGPAEAMDGNPGISMRVPDSPNADPLGSWVVNPSFDAPDSGAAASLFLISLAALGFVARRRKVSGAGAL